MEVDKKEEGKKEEGKKHVSESKDVKVVEKKEVIGE